MVDFFGVKVPAPRGPATLALRTEAVTLPMFAIRRSADRIVLSVDAPILPLRSDDLEASVVATTALYTRRIEAAIREYPDQWNWIGLPQARRRDVTRRHGADPERIDRISSRRGAGGAKPSTAPLRVKYASFESNPGFKIFFLLRRFQIAHEAIFVLDFI